MSNSQQVVVAKQGAGMVAGIMACLLAVLGIIFAGVIFVPIAAVVALIGSTIAIKNRNIAGIGVNALAWLLTVVGLLTSPVLWGAIAIVAGGGGGEMTER